MAGSGNEARGSETATTSPRAPQSLAEALRAADDAVLAMLLRLRPDLITPVPADLSALTARATTSASVSRAIDRLDRWTLQVAEAVAVLPPPVDESRLAAALAPATTADVSRALEALHARALIWDDGDGLRLPRAAAEAFGPTPAGLGASYALRPDVAGFVADPTSLETLLAAAPPQALEVLDRLTWGPPTGSVLGADRPVDKESARTPVEWLLAHGLLVVTGPDTVVLPRELALLLRGGQVHRHAEPVPPAVTTSDHAPATVDRLAGTGALELVRVTERLLDAWALEPAALLRAGGLGVREVRRAAQLAELDERRVSLVAELAWEAGLVGPSSAGDGLLPTPAYDLWLTQEPAHRWAALVAPWLDTSRVSALGGTKDSRDRLLAVLGPDLSRTVAPELRRVTLEQLTGLPEGAAPTLAGLTDRVEWRLPRRGPSLRPDLVRWTVEEAEWLGLLGRGAAAHPLRALLEAGPAAAAGVASQLMPEPLDHVLLQADLTAVAPGPLETSLSAELALLADVESTGGATVYRFSPGSVRRALDAGRSADDILTMLAARSRTPVPQPLRYLVEDAARRHGRLRVGTAAGYIRCDDESLVAELVADRRLATLRLRRLAPTVLVSPAEPDELLDGLRRAGFAPAAESAEGAVLVRRPDSRRAPQRRPLPPVVDLLEPDAVLTFAAVRALRAGDRAASAPRGRSVSSSRGGVVPHTATTETVALLREALAGQASVWIGFVDGDGGTSERVVDPVSIGAGTLTAYDHRVGAIRTFALHRITGAALIDRDASA